MSPASKRHERRIDSPDSMNRAILKCRSDPAAEAELAPLLTQRASASSAMPPAGVAHQGRRGARELETQASLEVHACVEQTARIGGAASEGVGGQVPLRSKRRFHAQA